MATGDGGQPPPDHQTASVSGLVLSPATLQALSQPPTVLNGKYTYEDRSLTPETKMCIDSLTPGQQFPNFTDTENGSTTDDEGFTLVKCKKGKKRCHEAKSLSSGSSTIISVVSKKSSLTVIFMPVDQRKVVTKLNQLRLSELLESKSHGSIIQIRPNYRLNLISVDVRNSDGLSSLLKVTSLLGIPVRSFEPRSQAQATGVIRGVDTNIDSAEIHAQLKANNGASVTSVRRMDTSTTVAITVSSSRIPEYALLGLVRHKVDPFWEKPIQCHQCCHYGHVKSTCRNSPTCSRCAGPHQRNDCDAGATTVRCCNCGKEHECDITSMRKMET
ncbi:hypothetical protein HPB47_026050 [Ixodes persulcatus]|uniref:Uncharacterized protein n=1 Tax=Ixodes persulcatus TaxID=34615 RepID=A0AC60Q1T2_IXOPE|nr:hypothetical protein HPB47_026050 [Ixodes persulcatus]